MVADLIRAVDAAGLRLGFLGQRSTGQWACTLYRGMTEHIAGNAYYAPTMQAALERALGAAGEVGLADLM